MSIKKTIGGYVLTFIVVFLAISAAIRFGNGLFNLIFPSKAEPTAETSYVATSNADNTDGAVNEQHNQVNDDATTKKNAEMLINKYLGESRTGKAKDIYNEYSYLNLDGKLWDKIEELEFSMVEQAISEAKNYYFTDLDPVLAKTRLHDCQEFVGNYNKKLNGYVELLDGCETIDLSQMAVVDKGSIAPKGKTNQTDVFGNTYQTALELFADEYAFDGVYGIYYIDNLNVNSLSAIVAPTETLFVTSREYHITISSRDADGNDTVLYRSKPLTKTSLPEKIVVDIPEGTPFLKIGCTTGSVMNGPAGDALLADPVLSYTITEDEWNQVEEALLL